MRLSLRFIAFFTSTFVRGVYPRPTIEHATIEKARVACAKLARIFGPLVVQSSSGNYTTEREENWSQTCWLSPSCIVSPASTGGVAEVLGILRQTGAEFAVRSGGHSTNTGWANINDGVLVDLQSLTELDIIASDSGSIARIGVGNRWIQVYDFLHKFHLTVGGGHSGDVGVPGLVLGGGLSYLSGSYGFTCDQVASFEIVLANSSIINVDALNHPDLFFGLKGGSSNFGIVTRIDFNAQPDNDLWYLSNSYNTSDCEELLSRLVEYQLNSAETFSDLGLVVAVHLDGCLIEEVTLANSTLLQTRGFRAFDGLVPVSQQLFPNASHVQIVALQDTFPFNGVRRTFRAWTTVPDAAVYNETLSIWREKSKQLSGIATTQYVPQVITTRMIKGSKDSALGLVETPQTLHPVVVYEETDAKLGQQIGAFWNSSKDDDVVLEAMAEIETKSRQLAAERGKELAFIYLNDATSDQDVFAGYGRPNLERLRALQKRYDPSAVFQKLMPGGFKLRRNESSE